MAEKPYPKGGVEPKQKHHPLVNPDRPDVLDDENHPGLGRGDRVLTQQRAASGGLTDDPTESGEPVRNKVPFKNLTGGR